jgi:hypothetical protein
MTFHWLFLALHLDFSLAKLRWWWHLFFKYYLIQLLKKQGRILNVQYTWLLSRILGDFLLFSQNLDVNLSEDIVLLKLCLELFPHVSCIFSSVSLPTPRWAHDPFVILNWPQGLHTNLKNSRLLAFSIVHRNAHSSPFFTLPRFSWAWKGS